MDRQLITEAISFRIKKTKGWREQQALRWPDDPRNLRAAKSLAQLAAGDLTISDEQWRELQSLAQSPLFNEHVDAAARSIEFRTRAATFSEFIHVLIQRAAEAAA